MPKAKSKKPATKGLGGLLGNIGIKGQVAEEHPLTVKFVAEKDLLSGVTMLYRRGLMVPNDPRVTGERIATWETALSGDDRIVEKAARYGVPYRRSDGTYVVASGEQNAIAGTILNRIAWLSSKEKTAAMAENGIYPPLYKFVGKLAQLASIDFSDLEKEIEKEPDMVVEFAKSLLTEIVPSFAKDVGPGHETEVMTS